MGKKQGRILLAAQVSVEKRAEDTRAMSELQQGGLDSFKTMQGMQFTGTNTKADKKANKDQTISQKVDARIKNQTAI